MTELSRADLRGALELVRRVESAPDLGGFHTEVLAGLRRLVPSDLALLEIIDPRRGRAERHELPLASTTEERAAAFERYMHQHPALVHVARTGDPRPLRISDFLSRRRLHRLDLYDAVLRPAGIEHQIALTVEVAPPLVLGITLNRGRRDFSQRDRALLALLRAHLSTARENAELRQLHLVARRGFEEASGVALLSKVGTIIAASPAGTELLSAYLNGTARPPYLPSDLEDWVSAMRLGRDGDGLLPRDPELTLEGPRGRLVVRFLPGAAPAESDALLLTELCPPIDRDALRSRGLTGRELEVLGLLAGGVPTKRVAIELGISARTVSKHLERAYRKLGVSSRGAAVAMARRDAGA